MMNKELESEIHCPACHTLYGEIFRVQQNETVWSHETVPPEVPKYCTRCDTVLERRRA